MPKKEKIQYQAVKQFGILITTALAFVAGLAWNEAIQALFREIFGTPNELNALFSYAIIVTILAVILTLWIGKIIGKLSR